ncbi:MAG: peptide ABC transporter substrate-binding protein [Anaerolineales bacterium]|nr:peptide ABC transporter substrate-binding protein [Anaerolineales bacterium]
MKKIFVFPLLCIFFVTACSPTPASIPSVPALPSPSVTPTAPPTPLPAPTTKVLRIGLPRYPDVLDPQRAPLGTEAHALKLVYEGLTTIDEKGNVVGGGADKWTSSPDGLQMTFHIRDGLKRADGTAVTARDYEYALKRALDPRIAHKTNPVLLYDIKGAEQADKLDPIKTKPEEIDKALNNLGIKVTDNQTLVVTFQKPNGYWQAVAATLALFPTDKKWVDRDPDNWWSRPDAHNGTGAFIVKSIEQNKRIVFAPNPNYWRGKPKLDRLELIYFPGGKGLLDAYKKGEIDLATGLSADDLNAFNADAVLKNELVRAPTAIVYTIAFNRARKPFDDKNVRVAFAQAFDREGWVRETFKGIGKPYTRWIPPGVPGAQLDKPGVPKSDPKTAVQTLLSNGYAAKESTAENPKVDCAKLGEIKLTYLASPTNQARFGFLAANFAQVFGCPITLDPTNQLPSKTKPQISLQGYIQDYPHPQNWLSMYWTCVNEFAAVFGYCNKELDALLARADQERDPQKALALYQQAEELLLKDVPAAFANYTENISLIKSYVLGLKDRVSAFDTEWAGEWGPVWAYDVELSQVPASYPRK